MRVFLCNYEWQHTWQLNLVSVSTALSCHLNLSKTTSEVYDISSLQVEMYENLLGMTQGLVRDLQNKNYFSSLTNLKQLLPGIRQVSVYYLNQIDSLIQLELKCLDPKLFSLVVICCSYTTVCGINYNAVFLFSRISLDKNLCIFVTFPMLSVIRNKRAFLFPQYLQEVTW